VLHVAGFVDHAPLCARNEGADLIDLLALPSLSIAMAFFATELPYTREVFFSERRISAVERSSEFTIASFTF
jgi:hypothetical protein